jgi:hypothetical protein
MRRKRTPHPLQEYALSTLVAPHFGHFTLSPQGHRLVWK